jgi:hypothetical protein
MKPEMTWALNEVIAYLFDAEQADYEVNPRPDHIFTKLTKLRELCNGELAHQHGDEQGTQPEVIGPVLEPESRGPPQNAGQTPTLDLEDERMRKVAAELQEALECLLEQTVDMDLKYGISLTEGEEEARAKALAAIAKASRAQERTPETEEQNKNKELSSAVCSLDMGRFSAVIHAVQNVGGEMLPYPSEIRCDGCSIFSVTLRHELAGVQHILESGGVEYLSQLMRAAKLPEPTAKDYEDCRATVRTTLDLITRFVERGHTQVLRDPRVAEELGIALSPVCEPDITRER